jgi:predicted nucleic acid-binding protein
MNKKPKLSALIFIDTNIYLDFYRYRKSDISLKYLELFEKHKDKIITTSQVEMEFKKNRQVVLLETIGKLKGIDSSDVTLPTILLQTKAADMVNEKKKAISKHQQVLKSRIEKILKNPKFNDQVYKSLEKIFTNDSNINLNRDNELRFNIRDLAKKRFELGYPPRKDKDTSYGDAINWEWIIYCAKNLSKDIIIVSRDSDYGVNYSNEHILNDWLTQEFRQRVSSRKKVILTDKLHTAFNYLSISVTKEMKIEEDKFVNDSTTKSSSILTNAGVTITGGTSLISKLIEETD